MRYIFTILLIACTFVVSAQNPVDITGINSWPKLHNSVTHWEDGAFNISPDGSNQNDLSWGGYDPVDHNVYGDSLYIIQLADDSYRQLYVEQLVNGMFTFHYAEIDGTNAQTVVLDKDDFQGKNFGHYSFYFEAENHTIEPLTDEWDMVFMRYNRPSDYYGVAGVLTNKHVQVAEADGIDTALVDPSTLTYSDEINTIGYDWKQFGSSGFEVVPDRSYYLIDETGDTTTLIFHDFSGSAGGGVCDFTINGEFKTIQMGSGYVNRVFYDLENGVTHTSPRNAWDIAFDGTDFGTAIRTNEEIGTDLWIYPGADASAWNGNVSVVENNKDVSFVNVYPVPMTDELTIYTGTVSQVEIKVQLLDLAGRIVSENMVELNKGVSTSTLDVSALPSGIFNLMITDANGNVLDSKKVVK